MSLLFSKSGRFIRKKILFIYKCIWLSKLNRSVVHLTSFWVLRKLVETLFFSRFQSSFSDVFCWFQAWNHWKRINMNKNCWKRLKKVFWPTFRCAQHLKSGWNTQHRSTDKITSAINGFNPYWNSQCQKQKSLHFVITFVIGHQHSRTVP